MSPTLELSVKDLLNADKKSVTGVEILTAIHHREEQPSLRAVAINSTDLQKLLDKADYNTPNLADSKISATQLRDIVDWAQRGACFHQKFGSSETAMKYFAMAQVGINALICRAEGYNTEKIETSDPFASLRAPESV